MFVFVVFLAVLLVAVSQARPTEQERVRLWHEKNTWPPTWHEESQGYRKLMENREREIMDLTGGDERWENWMQYIQSRLVPAFTDVGFKVIQTPPHVHAKLKAAVDAAVAKWDDLPYEHGVSDSIYAFDSPKFVHIHELAWETIRELLPLHEEWASGIKLRPTSAYGVRLYQNGSTIVMHNDKPQTHVISSIIHIAHQYDDNNQPWPIHIEDHDGNLHAVSLEEGQMLFYESAKCLHGRMRVLKGKFYGSLFVHYQPVDKNVWGYTVEDVIAAVPPHWGEGIKEEHGSRWAGQAITTDSRVVDNAPPRTSNNKPPSNQYEVEEDYADAEDEL
jgi:hypothetical protein